MRRAILWVVAAAVWLAAAIPAFTQNPNISGSITAASSDCTVAAACVKLLTSADAGAVALTITGTFSATLQFEGSIDQVVWSSIQGTALTSGTATSATSTGAWQFSVAGLRGFRVRCSAFTSGTATIALQASASSPAGGGGGGGGGGTVTQSDPTQLNATAVGTKTNNNAAPGTNNLGVLPAVANAAIPSRTEGNQVALSTDLLNQLRMILCDAAGNSRCANVDASGNVNVATPSMLYNSSPPSYANGASVSQFEPSTHGGITIATGTDPANVGYDTQTLVFLIRMINQIANSTAAPKAGSPISQVAGLSPVLPSLAKPVGMIGDRIKIAVPDGDPCLTQERTEVPISQTASTKVVAGRAGQRIHICQLRVVVANAAAEITSEWEGTGSACGTGTIAHSGSTAAANGESFPAGGGYQSGDGSATVILTGWNNDFCLAQSGSNRVSGKLQYVYAPN